MELFEVYKIGIPAFRAFRISFVSVYYCLSQVISKNCIQFSPLLNSPVSNHRFKLGNIRFGYGVRFTGLRNGISCK